MEWVDKYTATKIDEGSYGTIYVIDDDPSHVIKSLRPDYTDPEDRRRILREIHCLNELKGNPNVIEIGDNNSHAALPWFVMPRATINLHDYVVKRGPLNDDDTIYITRSILNAMEDAHQRTILHRDLGPSNILLFINNDTIDFDVRVADFSLGRDYRKKSKQLTRSTHVGLGQDDFISQEQYDCLENASSLSDIYSIGALMKFMLTGRSPLRSNTTSSLNDIIIRLMEHSPNRRPNNIAEVSGLIDRFERIRSPQRVRMTFQEIGSAFSSEQFLSEENIMDLTGFLTKENRLNIKYNEGNLTFYNYFVPLVESPTDLIQTWARQVSPSNVDLFMDRFQEQLEVIVGQTKWSFSSMKDICYFLMTLYPIDRLKPRIAELITLVYSNNFNEASNSLVQIITSEYDEDRIIMQIALAISRYSNNDRVKKFIFNNEDRIKHFAFIEAFSF